MKTPGSPPFACWIVAEEAVMREPQEIDDSPAEQVDARVAAVDVAKASGRVVDAVRQASAMPSP